MILNTFLYISLYVAQYYYFFIFIFSDFFAFVFGDSDTTKNHRGGGDGEFQ